MITKSDEFLIRIKLMRLPNKQIIGLDISNRKIKFAQIRYASGRWFVEKSGAKSIPDDEGFSTSQIIAKTIHELFEEYKMDAKLLVSAISGKDAVIKIIRLPTPKQSKKLDELMNFELPRHIPLSIQETAYDYQPLHNDAVQTTVLLAAIRRDVLEQHLRILADAGITPACVTPSSIMLANAAIAHTSGGDGIEKSVSSEGLFSAVVNVTDTTADVVVLEGEVLHHARTFAWRHPDAALRAGQRDEDDFQGKLLAELKNTLSPYQLSQATLLIEEDVDLEITPETVKSELPVPRCEIRQVNCELAGELAKSDVLPPPYLRLDLQKPILAERKAARRLHTRSQLLKVAPVVAVLILMAVSSLLWRGIERKKEELASLEWTRGVIEQRQSQLKELTLRHEKVAHLLEELRWAETVYPAWSYRLYQIAASTPNAIRLKEISTPEAAIPKKKLLRPVMSTLYVTGYARAQMEIDRFMQNLKRHDCFAEVGQESSRQVFKSGEVLLEFQLRLKSIKGQP